jgi:hypothetical protein
MSTELRSIDLEWDMRILNYATLIASFGSGGGRHRFTVCGTSVSRCHQRNRTCTFGAWRSTGSWRIMRGWAWRPAAAFRRRRNSCWSLSHVGLSGLMPIIICGNLLERECLSECRISHSRICRFIALLQISSLTLRHYHASSLKRTTNEICVVNAILPKRSDVDLRLWVDSLKFNSRKIAFLLACSLV